MLPMEYSRILFLKKSGASRKLWMQNRTKYGRISSQFRRMTVRLIPVSRPMRYWIKYISGTAANTTIQKSAKPFISILVSRVITGQS